MLLLNPGPQLSPTGDSGFGSQPSALGLPPWPFPLPASYLNEDLSGWEEVYRKERKGAPKN